VGWFRQRLVCLTRHMLYQWSLSPFFLDHDERGTLRSYLVLRRISSPSAIFHCTCSVSRRTLHKQGFVCLLLKRGSLKNAQYKSLTRVPRIVGIGETSFPSAHKPVEPNSTSLGKIPSTRDASDDSLLTSLRTNRCTRSFSSRTAL